MYYFCFSGTPYEDTECVPCGSGYYAAGNREQTTCKEHTNCELNGEKTVLKGTTWHDNICSSCDMQEGRLILFLTKYI